VSGQHGGGVAADAEERGAGEVEQAGVAELDVEAETGEDVEEHGRDHQEGEVVVAKDGGDEQDPEDCRAVHDRLVARAAGRYGFQPAEPGREQPGNGAGGEQGRDRDLALHREERHREGSNRGERGQAGRGGGHGPG
jgi:hypothetical protein